ncbi:MAG: OmpH family outer membrane protein [Candidatus Omnitrophota bacterium]|nr:OmpH family outer membrane protein [Candidatus Omnitrophota bacterium]MBU1894997.1 OmpH family outer membrane protein [Candidatus Omnitrophota bacterium]
MIRLCKKACLSFVMGLMLFSFMAMPSYSQSGKIGYVDLRKAFYEYDKTKKMEDNLGDLTEDTQAKREEMVDKVTKLREESELLTGSAKEKKEAEIDKGLALLQDFDRKARQDILNKKNDMFKEVVEDIQKVVEDLGKKGEYEYIFDSRNIMYADNKFELTETVIKKLNKKKD